MKIVLKHLEVQNSKDQTTLNNDVPVAPSTVNSGSFKFKSKLIGNIDVDDSKMLKKLLKLS